MKTGLTSIKYGEKLDSTIVVDYYERTIANSYLCSLYSYLGSPRSHLVRSHEIYVDALFSIEDFLYGHSRDISVVYFSLLDYAVSSLKQLSKLAISYQEKLADYLEKAAVIFQTAADKTLMTPEQGSEFYQEIWKNKAQQYSQEAFRISNQKEQDIPHDMRMLRLYQKFAEQDSFAQKYLQHRCCEYRTQCEIPSNATNESRTDEALYLHHRQGFRFDSTDELDSPSAPLLPLTTP